MDRKFRPILIGLGVLVLLLVIVPYLIPVNQFRATIEQKASAALGRKVAFGNLGLSLFSGSLTADDLSIGDDPKFSQSPFLTAKSVKVGVEMMPLIFSRALHITSVTVEKPSVSLLQNAAGQWNYSSLGGPAEKSSKSKDASPGDLSMEKLTLKDGTVSVGTANSSKRSSYEHVSVTASGVSTTTKFPIAVSADLPGGGKFKLDGTAGPLDQSDTALTPIDAKLTVSSLNLASSGFLAPGTGLGGVLDVDANINSQAGEAETKGNARLAKSLFVSGGSPATVPLNVDFNTKYNLKKNAGVLNTSTVKIGGAIARLNGTYESSGEHTSVNMKLDAQNMPAKDLEAFLPALGINLPKGAAIQSGTLSSNLNIAGPTDALVTTGNVGLYSAKVTGFDLGANMSAISSLTGMKTGKDLDIEKMTSNLRITRDGVKADNFVAVVPAMGSLAGAGTIDAKNNLDFKMAATLTNAVGAVASPVSSAAGVLGQLRGGGAGGGCKGTTIPFLIQGTTASPKFVPDVGGLAAGMLKSQLGCAGGAVTGVKTPKPADALSGIGGLFKKPAP